MIARGGGGGGGGVALLPPGAFHDAAHISVNIQHGTWFGIF